ncbi:hypothetical protein SCP_0300890 [Sparassis crispa]|uniref:AAA+ ATPase domain-containing protein n=1 Tax=Sparassis crispa TaxID=139825 RepID=A0A401GDW4_9APHY|nr:hypothetical protein SCP_0300890 [Sparassis crispa]GBE80374.1 hypothetical protein SCP_0300890 [Sparassis crispa]
MAIENVPEKVDAEALQNGGIGPPKSGAILEVKYLHEALDGFGFKYTAEPPYRSQPQDLCEQQTGSDYTVYAFVVINCLKSSAGGQTVPDGTTILQVNSTHLINIGKDVIGEGQGVSWTSSPVRVEPQLLLSFLSELQQYAKELNEKSIAEDGSSLCTKCAHLSHLLDFLKAAYSSTIETLSSLLAHGEVSFDFLWALYVPRKTLLYLPCPVTGEPRAARLVQAELCEKSDDQEFPPPIVHQPTSHSSAKKDLKYWRLALEYVEADVGMVGVPMGELGSGTGMQQGNLEPRFGLAMLNVRLEVHAFKGTQKISSLLAYPICYYTGPGGESGLMNRLLARGRKWVAVAGGMHHKAYRGLAFRYSYKAGGYVKMNVDSRIIADRKRFQDLVPHYKLPIVTKAMCGHRIDKFAVRAGAIANSLSPVVDLTEMDLLLTSPIIYGFSLSDKQWLEFIIDYASDIEWNDEAYDHLVIPIDHKIVLKTLVQSYSTGAMSKFDDFVAGKGLGLVINLYGSPGTGKSMTAEGISEYLHKPLYVVGVAELGTTAEVLDFNLSAVLKAAAAWGAVVLLDEADVFLEERSLQYLERNAMVAVFLRRLEYFTGILFLTTNRVRVFDEAFQSRIHLSLHYHDLLPDAREHIWTAFMKKINGNVPRGGLTQEELRELCQKNVNGRQIKNVVRTGGAIAASKQEPVSYQHLSRVLDLMEQFHPIYVSVEDFWTFAYTFHPCEPSGKAVQPHIFALEGSRSFNLMC